MRTQWIILAILLGGCGQEKLDIGNDVLAARGTVDTPWAGHKYLLSVGKSNWTSPRGIGADLDGFVPAFTLDAVGPSVTIGAAQFDATPETAEQDVCGPTEQVALTADGQIGPTALRVHVRNDSDPVMPVQVTAAIYELKLNDVLPVGSTVSTAGTLEATLDLRGLYPLFTALGPSRTPASICESLRVQYTSVSCLEDSCAVKCGPCPTDAEPYCLTVRAEGLGAVEAPDLELVPIEAGSVPSSCADAG